MLVLFGLTMFMNPFLLELLSPLQEPSMATLNGIQNGGRNWMHLVSFVSREAPMSWGLFAQTMEQPDIVSGSVLWNSLILFPEVLGSLVCGTLQRS